MNNKIIRKIATFALPLIMITSFASAVSATVTVANYGANDASNINLVSATTVDPKTTVINLINYVLSLLALIAVIIVMIGGFKWMTAMGNEEKIGEAKKLLIGGLVGLVIILLAWVIAYFVINTIVTQSVVAP